MDKIVGEQGQKWMLSSSSFMASDEGTRIRVTGYRGFDYTSDIAIDDLGVDECAGSIKRYTIHYTILQLRLICNYKL